MPSVGSILLGFNRNQHLHKERDAMGAYFPVVDPFNAYYLLNPSGDLSSTQVEFEKLFKDHNWEVNLLLFCANNIIIVHVIRKLFMSGRFFSYLPPSHVNLWLISC